MDTSVVVAFSESPALRETLAVLLEHDCQLRFLRPGAAASADCAAASVALLAIPQPEPVVQDLQRHWPVLPIVAVDIAEREASRDAAITQSDSRLCRVPLEPHAIRSSVLQRLAPDREASLRTTARVLATTLRADLSYSFAALRSFSALHASSVGPDTYALLGAVMREQSYVLSETVAQLQRFRRRARVVDMSPHFSTALCHQLERPDRLSGERGMLCKCTVDTACPEAGPLELAPAVAEFVHAHLRRTADAPIIRVSLQRDGLTVRYPRRRAVATTRSWPLLLAALALQPWSWSVGNHVDGDQEVVSLRPAA
jgi:hypothetical protein